MDDEIIIYTDGGARGNPGPAAAGFILLDLRGKTIEAKAFYLGKATNNFAEYSAVVKALQAAEKINFSKVTLYSDSELLVKQINGQYKVKSQNLKDIYEKTMKLVSSFDKFKAVHITRDKNALADSLVNASIDKKADIDRTSKKVDTVCLQKPVRLGVLISGGGTTLLNLKKEIEAGKLNAEIALVISSRTLVAGVQRAKDAGLDVRIIRRKDFADIAEFSKSIEKELTAANVDLVIQAGWLCLWDIPERFNDRVMNIHPALLPSFGGQGMWGHNVHEAVLKAGVKISGCTVHFCTNEYDRGPIIVQRICPVKEEDTPDSLAERVFKEECIAYPQAIRLFAENRLKIENGTVKILV